MDERLLSAFDAAARATFRDMFGIEALGEAPRVIDTHQEHGWDITGLVGLAGQVHGVVAFRLTAKLAAKLLAGSGVESPSGGEDQALVRGLVGEIANILAGQAATALPWLDIEIAPPVVVRGPNHTIGWPAIAPVQALCYRLPSGEFEVDLCVKD